MADNGFEPSKKSIRYVKRKARKRGKTITNERAVNTARRLTYRDKFGGAATKFDYAKDGKGKKDKDFGTDMNNSYRAEKGARTNTTMRANVKKSGKFGTGKIVYKKIKANKAAGEVGSANDPKVTQMSNTSSTRRRRRDGAAPMGRSGKRLKTFDKSKRSKMTQKSDYAIQRAYSKTKKIKGSTGSVRSISKKITAS